MIWYGYLVPVAVVHAVRAQLVAWRQTAEVVHEVQMAIKHLKGKEVDARPSSICNQTTGLKSAKPETEWTAIAQVKCFSYYKNAVSGLERNWRRLKWTHLHINISSVKVKNDIQLSVVRTIKVTPPR